MIDFDELDSLTDPFMELYERFIQSVINEIARRLGGMEITSSSAWMVQRLTESGAVYEYALGEIAKLTGISESELKRAFQKAGVNALKFDDAVYMAAGLKPPPLNLSPAMSQVLAAGLRKTGNVMRNLTMTTAIRAQNAFIDAADLAYMQVSSGAFDYISAIRNAVKDLSAKGLTVIRYPGRQEQLDVAVRRTVLTGVSQTANELQITRAKEMKANLMEVSAHIGARDQGEGAMNHESWQGKVYSIEGSTPEYPNLYEVTGLGTGEGLGGYNCVLGDTLVSGFGIRTAYRRKYSGELIVIRTAGGHELTVTPNHPILTDKGWIAAGLLNCGDNVISRTSFDGDCSTSPYVNEHESRIEDVFNSLGKSRYVFRFPSSAGYFHGDISDGEIDTVFPKRFLGNWIETALLQHEIEVALSCTPESSDPLSTVGRVDKILLRPDHPTDSVMSCFSEIRTPFGAGSFEPETHRFRTIFGAGNAKIGKVLSYEAFRNPSLGGDLVFPQTRVVHGEQFLRSDSCFAEKVQPPVISICDSVSFHAILDDMHRATVLIGDVLIRFTGHEKIDNIVFIDRKSAKGSSVHVYNLETKDGWYFANNIITHNCRHSMYPFFEGISERMYSDAELKNYANKTVVYNGDEMSVYEATQVQRGIERKIRHWKRQAGALDAAGLDNTYERVKLGEWQARMRDFVKQTGLYRQSEREQVSGNRIRAISK